MTFRHIPSALLQSSKVGREGVSKCAEVVSHQLALVCFALARPGNTFERLVVKSRERRTHHVRDVGSSACGPRI
eukprot:2891709-Amphidinium_carterae.2